jgi:glycosyltransferase involved in cell wall biosynthesis
MPKTRLVALDNDGNICSGHMTLQPAIKISLIIPVYNEASALPALVEKVGSILKMSEDLFELIFVDDGSEDSSWETIRKLAETSSYIKALRFTHNFGKESAIQAGLKSARGNCAVIMDADLQHPPELLPKMISIWEKEGYDVVEGVKTIRQRESLLNRGGSIFFYKMLRALSGFDIRSDTDYKLLDRKVVNVYLSLSEKSRFFRALIPFLGFRTAKVPFSPDDRVSGKSKFSLFSLFNLAVSAITSFSSMPLHFVTILGILTLLFSFYLGIDTLYMKLSGQAIGGFATVILIILMIGSILMIALGIIGEYIARIFEEIKNRPLYVVNETLNMEYKGKKIP